MTQEQHSAVHLDHLGVIDVSGDDASTFLQGQFCNDVTALPQPGSQLTGFCSPKGRLLAAPILLRRHGGFRLLLPIDLLESFLQRIRMFVLRADVTFTHRDDVAVLGVVDPASSLWSTAGLAVPDAALSVTENGDASALAWDDRNAKRWLVVVPSEALAGVETDVTGSWRLADIRAGLPTVVAATREVFVPQMVNFAAVGALSFTKGCYPGQEIVARTQYLGKLKKHMQRFVAVDGVTPDQVPSAGDVLGEPGSADAGEVVDAVAGANGTLEALVVVRRERAVDAGLPLPGGGELVPAALPYELPGDEPDAEAT